MIQLDLPQPPPEERTCEHCGRPNCTGGELFHWPDAGYKNRLVKLFSGAEVEPFSYWVYECRWHRSARLRRGTVGSTLA